MPLVQPCVREMEPFDSRRAFRSPLSGSASTIEAERAGLIGKAPDENLVLVGKPEAAGRRLDQDFVGRARGRAELRSKNEAQLSANAKEGRAVMVVPSHLSALAPHLRRKNFHPVILPAFPLDKQHKECWLAGRTLTDQPGELECDDVPVLEFSLNDASKVEADDEALAEMISRAWRKLGLKTEGWFILRLRKNGRHTIEFPE